MKFIKYLLGEFGKLLRTKFKFNFSQSIYRHLGFNDSFTFQVNDRNICMHSLCSVSNDIFILEYMVTMKATVLNLESSMYGVKILMFLILVDIQAHIHLWLPVLIMKLRYILLNLILIHLGF